MTNVMKQCAMCLSLVIAAGSAHAQISGTIKWTDTAAATHGARGVTVFVVEENPILGSILMGSVLTNSSGAYSLATPLRPGATGYSVVAFANNSAAYVSSDGTSANTYLSSRFFFTPVPVPGSDITTLAVDPANDAFSIVDAMYTGHYWASAVRAPDAPASQIPVLYPRASAGSAYFPPALAGPTFPLGRIEIGPGQQHDWDIIDHEYTHYLQNLDSMNASLGGPHSSGVSNIPALGKNLGSRLAFAEGFATWSGVSSHGYDTVGQNMPAVPNTSDAAYTDTPGGFTRNIETSNTANQGEGDEAPVYRILWDLADPANEPHDRVSIGHEELYHQIRAISIPVAGGAPDRRAHTLADVWNHDINLGTDFPTHVNFGAIFQQYGVSPAPAFSDIMLSITDPAPTFEWFGQNNGANDHFRVIVLDSTLDSIIWSEYITGAETYTMTPADWLFFQSNPGDYRVVIAGADLWVDGSMTPHPAGDESGYYWSDAYGFHIVPTPGALGLAMLGCAIATRRRRVSEAGRTIE